MKVCSFSFSMKYSLAFITISFRWSAKHSSHHFLFHFLLNVSDSLTSLLLSATSKHLFNLHFPTNLYLFITIYFHYFTTTTVWSLSARRCVRAARLWFHSVGLRARIHREEPNDQTILNNFGMKGETWWSEILFCFFNIIFLIERNIPQKYYFTFPSI